MQLGIVGLGRMGAFMAQRLIRVLCPKCKQPDKDPDPMWLKLLGITPKEMEGKTVSPDQASPPHVDRHPAPCSWRGAPEARIRA